MIETFIKNERSLKNLTTIQFQLKRLKNLVENEQKKRKKNARNKIVVIFQTGPQTSLVS